MSNDINLTPIDVESSAAEPTRKIDALDDKPDINDVPADESQVKFCPFLLVEPKAKASYPVPSAIGIVV